MPKPPSSIHTDCDCQRMLLLLLLRAGAVKRKPLSSFSLCSRAPLMTILIKRDNSQRANNWTRQRRRRLIGLPPSSSSVCCYGLSLSDLASMPCAFPLSRSTFACFLSLSLHSRTQHLPLLPPLKFAYHHSFGTIPPAFRRAMPPPRTESCVTSFPDPEREGRRRRRGESFIRPSLSRPPLSTSLSLSQTS